MQHRAIFALMSALVLAAACAPTGGEGRSSWSAGLWRDGPAPRPNATAAEPPPARGNADSGPPLPLRAGEGRPPAAAKAEPAPAAPEIFYFDGVLLRTVQDDVVTVHQNAALVRRETGGAPAYCTQDARATRTGRAVCLYDRNGDDLLDSFTILGDPEVRYYAVGPFPFAPEHR